MPKAPAFLLNPVEHLLTIRVQRMSYEAQGVYAQLLGRMWAESEDQSSIETLTLPRVFNLSKRRLARILKDILWDGDPLLVIAGSRYVSPYLQSLKAQWERTRQAQSEAGKETARKRWGDRSSATSSPSSSPTKSDGSSASSSPIQTATTTANEPPPVALPGEGGPGEEGEGSGTEGSDGPPAGPPSGGAPRARQPDGETAAPVGAGTGPDPLGSVNFRRSEGLLKELRLAAGVAQEIALTTAVGRVFRVILEARKQRRPAAWARRAFENGYDLPPPEGPDLEAVAQFARELEAEARARDDFPPPAARRPSIERRPGESDVEWLKRGQEAARARHGLRALDGKGRKAEA